MAGPPFQPEVAPGLALIEQSAVTVSGTTPKSATFTVTGNGIWLCTAEYLLNGNSNTKGTLTWIMTRWRGSANIVGADPIASSRQITPVTSVTAEAPDGAAGVGTFRVFGAWSDGGTYVNTVNVTMRKLATLT